MFSDPTNALSVPVSPLGIRKSRAAFLSSALQQCQPQNTVNGPRAQQAANTLLLSRNLPFFVWSDMTCDSPTISALAPARRDEDNSSDLIMTASKDETTYSSYLIDGRGPTCRSRSICFCPDIMKQRASKGVAGRAAVNQPQSLIFSLFLGAP